MSLHTCIHSLLLIHINFDNTADASLITSRLEVPTIYAITPTYTRYTQRVDLTSLCHTLMHVPEITWIVVEDAVNKTQAVTNLLAKCKSVTSVHLAVKSPNITGMGKGVSQRNAGLNWIRQTCGSNAMVKCRGVVYLMDDDNKYDLRLFQEVGIPTGANTIMHTLSIMQSGVDS